MHFAGTITVGRGELEITFKELKSAMHDAWTWQSACLRKDPVLADSLPAFRAEDLWFVDFPKHDQLKKGSLVRVQAQSHTS